MVSFKWMVNVCLRWFSLNSSILSLRRQLHASKFYLGTAAGRWWALPWCSQQTTDRPENEERNKGRISEHECVKRESFHETRKLKSKQPRNTQAQHKHTKSQKFFTPTNFLRNHTACVKITRNSHAHLLGVLAPEKNNVRRAVPSRLHIPEKKKKKNRRMMKELWEKKLDTRNTNILFLLKTTDLQIAQMTWLGWMMNGWMLFTHNSESQQRQQLHTATTAAHPVMLPSRLLCRARPKSRICDLCCVRIENNDRKKKNAVSTWEREDP